MRDAMKAVDEVGRFSRIGFDAISLRSEYHRVPYRKSSENIMAITAELECLHDRINTKTSLDQIE